MLHEIANALLETLYMVLIASIPVALIGTLISVLHYMSKNNDFSSNSLFSKTVDAVINGSYNLPYFVLIIAFIPLGKMLATVTNMQIAVLVPVVLAALPVFSLNATRSLSSVPAELISMAKTNGASKRQILTKVVFPEAKFGFLRAYGTTLTALVSCTTIAGIIGANGLGRLLIEKGYRHFDLAYVIAIVVALIAVNQSIAFITRANVAK